MFFTPGEIVAAIGSRARAVRQARGLRQADAARAAGVALTTLKRFEAGRGAGLDAVLKIALALHAEDEFALLFPLPERRTLDEVIAAARPRRRVRVSRT